MAVLGLLARRFGIVMLGVRLRFMWLTNFVFHDLLLELWCRSECLLKLRE